MTLSSSVTEETRAAARTAIRAVLQETRPDLDISVGGVIDSVLVEGSVEVTAQNQADVVTAGYGTSLKAIADGTVTPDDATVDALMANYYVTRVTGTKATGSIEFVVQNDVAQTIPAGYKLTVGSVVFQSTKTWSIYTSSATMDDSVDTNRRIFKAYDSTTGYVNRFIVEVECGVVGPTGVLATGTQLTPLQSFTGLGIVRAVTNFSDGTIAETNAQFVTRALAGITAKMVGGRSNIDALALAAYPLAKTTVIGAESALLTRNLANVFGTPSGGKIDVYVKTGAVMTSSLRVVGTVSNVGTRSLTVTLPAPYAYGVYKVRVNATFSGAPVTITGGAVTITQTVRSATTRSDYNPTIADSTDLATSANESITLTIQDTRTYSGGYVVAISSLGQTISDVYNIEYDYMPGVAAVADSIYSFENRPPGVDPLVKAAVPCMTTLVISAAKPSTYTGPTAAVIASSIAVGVNQLTLRQVELTSFTISTLLTSISPQLTLQAVAMSGTIYGQDGVDYAATSTGSALQIPVSVPGRFSYENAFFATAPQLVTVTLV